MMRKILESLFIVAGLVLGVAQASSHLDAENATQSNKEFYEEAIDLNPEIDAGSPTITKHKVILIAKDKIGQSCFPPENNEVKQCKSDEFYVACNCYEEKIVQVVAPDGFKRCKSSTVQWGSKGSVEILENTDYQITARVQTSGINPFKGGHQHGRINVTWIREGLSESTFKSNGCETSKPTVDEKAICGCFGINTSFADRYNISECYKNSGTRCDQIGYDPGRESGVRYSVCVSNSNYCQGAVLRGYCHVHIPHTDPVFYIPNSAACR